MATYSYDMPRCSIPVENSNAQTQDIVPSMVEQINFLVEAAERCSAKLNYLSSFLLESPLEFDNIDGKSASCRMAYVKRTLDAMSNKLDLLNEYFR